MSDANAEQPRESRPYSGDEEASQNVTNNEQVCATRRSSVCAETEDVLHSTSITTEQDSNPNVTQSHDVAGYDTSMDVQIPRHASRLTMLLQATELSLQKQAEPLSGADYLDQVASETLIERPDSFEDSINGPPEGTGSTFDALPTQPAATMPATTSQAHTTHLAPAIIPDNDVVDEAYAESTTTSYVTSMASEVSQGVLENERLYPNYGQHSYGMPIDEDEMDRMDLQHRKYELVLGGKHFLAPIHSEPHRILDLGTGTGIWALDVADLYPSAQVIGVDVAPIQPKWVASNCQFEIDDIEATWTYKPGSFDFIHCRDPLFAIRDWPKLVEQCFEHLKPGGWCELACIYPVVLCDDGTMPEDSGFKVICEMFMEASAIFGAPTDCPVHFASYLSDAGFHDVSENIFKVPSSPWPKDKRLKKIGALEMTNVVEGAAAFSLRAFGRAFGWSREQTELVLVSFRKDVKNRNYHQYCQYFVVYGQKPPQTRG